MCVKTACRAAWVGALFGRGTAHGSVCRARVCVDWTQADWTRAASSVVFCKFTDDALVWISVCLCLIACYHDDSSRELLFLFDHASPSGCSAFLDLLKNITFGLGVVSTLASTLSVHSPAETLANTTSCVMMYYLSVDPGRSRLTECEYGKAAHGGSATQRIFRLGARATSSAGRASWGWQASGADWAASTASVKWCGKSKTGGQAWATADGMGRAGEGT